MNKQLHAFRGMRAVEADYAASGKTDTEFANAISDGTPEGNYSCAQIRHYRKNLGIENNDRKSRVTSVQVAEMRRLLAKVVALSADFNLNDLQLECCTILEATE